MSEDIITEKLKNLFSELTGEDLRNADLNESLFDLGFDSLVLTQASGALKKHFNVRVSFRELIETYTTISELANHISTQVPSEPSSLNGRQIVEVDMEQHPPESPLLGDEAPLAVPPGSSSPENGLQFSAVPDQNTLTDSVLERVMDAQLKVMEMQLAMFRGDTPGRCSAAVLPHLKKISAQTDKTKKTTNKEDSVQHGPFRPLEKKSRGGLSDKQKKHLGWLTRRYVARTSKSKEYTQRYRKHFADPRAVSGFNQQWKELVYPIVSTRSSGAYLWDLDGNRWLDITLGFGVNLLGHSPHFITEALKHQLDLGVEIGPQNPIAGEVAELICEFTGMERVAFCNTGSEAVMAAIRLCRTVTGRTRIVFFAGDYHGTFDEVLARGIWPGDHPKTLPLAPGVAPNLISEVTVLPYGTDQSLAWIRQHAAELAAVLVEPVQSRNPGLQPGAFLKELRRLTEAAETPLIFDEVITGFRCHPGGAQAYFGVHADLATYGKIIGGGMPIGFLAGRKEYMDALDGGFWRFGDESFPPSGVTFFAGTFVRHPLAMAAAKAMLLHLKKEGPRLQSDLSERTARLLDDLNGYFRKHRVPLELNHFTSLWYPHFGAEVKHGSLLYYHLREKGLHIWEGRPCFLSTAHTSDDEEFIKQVFKTSIVEMRQGGFLPESDGHSNINQAQISKIDGKGALSGASTDRPASSDLKRFPLSEAQHEMWVGAQMRPEAAGPHHACTGIYLDGNLDIENLRKAVRVVVKRHAGLRCTFSQYGNEAILHPSFIPEVPLHDFSILSENLRQQRVDTILHRESRRIFDLTKGPLFDFQIIKLTDQRHMLVFTVQMIVCDGWSHYVVFEDLGTIYSALIDGVEPKLKDAIPIWEHANWERANASSDRARDCEYFWVSQFKNVPAPINFPTAHPRSAIRTFRGDRQEIALSAGLSKEIKQLAKLQKNSYFAILLAAFGVWITRLSGSRDVVVGVPFAAQGPLDMDRLVGQCANMLPLRIQLDPKDQFSKVLKNTWSSVLDAQEHWDFSFGRLISKLNLPNDSSRIPLVSVLFNLDPPMSKVKFGGLGHRFISGPRYYFQYDMGFNLIESQDAIHIECDYNLELFDGDVVRRWLDGYQAILETVVQKPDYPVGRLPIMRGSDIQRLSPTEFSSKAAESPGLTVDAMFSAQAENTPEALAVATDSESLTYEQLDKRSSCLGSYLATLGVGPGSVVGVCVKRSIDLPVALLSILKTGGAYILIEPSLSDEEVVHVIKDDGVSVILVDDRTQSTFPSTSARMVAVKERRNGSKSETDALSGSSIDPERLACIVYRSSSNGTGRSVEITHRAIVNCLSSMKRRPGLLSEDIFLWCNPAISAYEIIEFWLPLSVGARSYLFEDTMVVDPAALSRVIDKQKITVMLATPSAWRILLDSGWQGSKKLKALCWGEELWPDQAERIEKKCNEVWSLYGTIETAMVSMTCQVRVETTVDLGRPVDNTNVILVDERFEPVPVGVPGEILISGYGLARGYRNVAALTAEKFIDLPIGDQDQIRFFRSGDMAKYHPDGGIGFVGRVDRRCSASGLSFHPGDVESVLLGHSAVKDAVVFYRRDLKPAGGMVAYILLGAREEKAVAFGIAELVREIRRLVRSRLPDYMVPDRIVVLEDIPRRADGRVDYGALPAPVETDLEVEDYVAPRNETEEMLAGIWQDLLNIEKMSVKDSFFDLGGQSLLAVRMFSRIEKAFGRRFPIAMLFRAPTIEQLARKLTDDEDTGPAWPSLVPIQPQGVNAPLFLIHGAGGNVLLYRTLARYLEPDFPLYGLQSQGLDGHSKSLKTIEEMADYYLQEIRTIQSKGPYFLGGYCLGGTVAYEIAQRLVAGGEKVALVAMLDTYNFNRALKVGFFRFMLQKIKFHLGNFARLRPSTMWKYLREKKRVAGDGGWAHIRTERPGTTLQGGVARAESGIEASVQELNDHAADIYDPKPYQGTLTLFKPHINYKFYPDPKMGWGDLALDGLDIVEMQINPHAMLLEPFVEVLARELRDRLDRLNQYPGNPVNPV